MGSFDEYPPHLRDMLQKVADAGYRDILLDERAGNRFLFETLAGTSDPVLREMGEQLRDGAIDLKQVAASSFFRDALQQGLERLEDFDEERFAADVDRATGDDRQAKTATDSPKP
ncbi:hypothetical protein GCM10010112_67020 [Actinoplanes lobatus]|uniref:Uncharacterized protein n=1 Tax=Actinoplanes lobatus TaxID=113568 RepID=A0A7W7HI59_9ACTN|nr:hypothetical protein [Actinoplanes lobatus]MBB4750970.1 hypothetical protein [Actinoplanes lobatus]GGN85983.1 hypothetical protein GCM10010112_67020 [Actinoplanes lobatus]GIE43543.1 hypothetical protein Alo02nite_64410 [Actinoplanes lobatus]